MPSWYQKNEEESTLRRLSGSMAKRLFDVANLICLSTIMLLIGMHESTAAINSARKSACVVALSSLL